MLPSIRTPFLTRKRIALAIAIAAFADLLQIGLGPLGWAFLDEIIDLIAMILLTIVLGFHPLFLPTFVVEFVPIVDMLPTWTGCVAIVIALRRKQQQPPKINPTPPGVIDI